MKGWGTVVLASLMGGLLSLMLQVRGEQPVNCQWGPYGEWSECDGCSKIQRRTRPILVYAQFGGTPCSGEASQTQACVTERGCPLQEGCGARFRCSSGQCISAALVCNGDQDCEEDGLDEQKCEESSSTNVCDNQRVPPNIELTGQGYDIVTGNLRGAVINTKSFGGQCRKVFSGDNRFYYRLPHSLLGYTFQVRIENDFSDEFYNSVWSYVKHTENRKEFSQGHSYQTFHDENFSKKMSKLLIIKNEVEVAQFQNSPPEYLTLSEEFWKALSALPATYDYAEYRALIDSGQTSSSYIDYHKCVTTRHSFLFISWSSTECNTLKNALERSSGYKDNKIQTRSNVAGGDPAYIAGLEYLDLQNPSANWDMYRKWAGSVKDLPTVIKQKLRPLYELVKEVPCAALKKHHLKRAIEAYLTEEHPCHCRPCHNNGEPILKGTTCTCICRPGTSGPACEYGTVVEEQPGVIHGGWTCWSAWSSCSQGQRSRTRTCSNPYPQMGGKHCNGEPEEKKTCQDEDLEHLRVMQPHCFDPSLSPAKSCKTPPPLGNGFVLEPKDVYPVGNKIVYSCIDGYHLLGDAVAECSEDQTWERKPMECKRTVCSAPLLPPEITGSPWNLTYQIGETITMTCPPERKLEGPSEILCDSSLNWSPQPENAKCIVAPTKVPDRTVVRCKPWKKLVKDRCVCKMPYECKSSLAVCATSPDTGQTKPLTVCKVQTLWCLGQPFTLAEDSACKWPHRETAPCSSCQLWETCDGEQTSTCRCKVPEECTEPGTLVCVRTEEGAAAVTMSECEAGIRRCRGETASVISVEPCKP
ncbi:hypothetical protein MATL_G00064130 [Megalops atlanticus]|uniref:Complement component C7 n=1 Tax=Megalops atlanticus TaxID=7932 RepID=A0A9D3TAF4_MEGAT|nr:hypothetical protein MATL_G00064130 [Megalops atlanticus]